MRKAPNLVQVSQSIRYLAVEDEDRQGAYAKVVDQRRCCAVALFLVDHALDVDDENDLNNGRQYYQ